MIRLPSIRSKLLALFFLFGAVPILVVSLLSYFNSMKAVEEMVGNRTAGVSSSVAESRDALLAQATDSEIIWVNKPVQSYLNALAQGNRVLAMEARDEVERYYPKIFERYQALGEIILADYKGRPTVRQKPSVNAQSGWELIGTQIGRAVSGLELFGGEEEDEKSGGFRFDMDLPTGNEVPRVPLELLGGFDDAEKEAARLGLSLERGDYRCLWTFTNDGDPEVRIVHPVFSNRETSKRLGVAILKLDSSELFYADLALEPFGRQGEIALVDESTGIALYHSNPAFVGRALNTADPDLWHAAMAMDGTESVARWQKASGEYGNRLVASNRLTNAPWRLMVTALPKEFASETQQAGIINLLIAALATLVAAFLVV
ncbi:MAG: cache domain-containing protein [Candidatus Eisenbacteria bacterium]|uniref:Cache domain-containing protein n=1 Tax=Eiseniibacteriota bacterium TaxID=2212470 RepID=A0A7Y2EAK1_UNCEI|nr:cache domain-containing protein [Candidatus Eisenbacteria bacterium]